MNEILQEQNETQTQGMKGTLLQKKRPNLFQFLSVLVILAAAGLYLYSSLTTPVANIKQTGGALGNGNYTNPFDYAQQNVTYSIPPTFSWSTANGWVAITLALGLFGFMAYRYVR